MYRQTQRYTERSPILLIGEDNRVIGMITMALEKAGYQVTEERDIPSGLQILFQLNPVMIVFCGQNNLPLSEADFIELRESVAIPLLVIGEPEDAVYMLENGADAYISLPLNIPELIARVKSLLRQHKMRDCKCAS
ncbi:MAG: hypothetical protein NUV31_10555 [Dehalococcoidales bacterium]|jgi:DNA-binding response OmpR family regulator|nr:hypothetical protein [Dehalococcoidales bacterium]